MIVSSEGDIGDCLYLLCILSQLDGKQSLLINESHATKARGKEGAELLVRNLKRLAEAQPYIKECRLSTPEDKVDWESAGFRKSYYVSGETLMGAHLNHLIRVKGIGRHIDTTRGWLTSPQSTESKGRIVINRTGRYRNQSFRWEQVVRHYRNRLLFVGLQHEWKEFCSMFGFVEHAPTNDMMDVAELIAGSEMFIGNQSCAFAIAEGLKHPAIQETSKQFPDCIFRRPNVQHVADGEMTLPDIGGSGELSLKRRKPNMLHLSTMTTPPGLWQFPGAAPAVTFPQMVAVVSSMEDWRDKPKDEIKSAILELNFERCPYFWNPESQPVKVQLAKEFAGY